MRGLLAETAGGGGETPYGTNDPTTPDPAHNIRYFCGVARRDFIDNQNPGTGKLAGAINRDYDLGPADIGHEKIKESQVVFNDFFSQLNAVPPGRRVAIVTDKASGNYAAPLRSPFTSSHRTEALIMLPKGLPKNSATVSSSLLVTMTQ